MARTRTRALTIALAAAGAAALLAAAPGSATPAPQPAEQPEPAEPDWAAIRRAHDDAMQRLAPLIGEWNAQGTMGRPDESGTRLTQAGTWSNRWLMDGKHLELTFDVAVGDGRTQWLAIVSYNAFRARYESVWIGVSGYRFAETGDFDDAGRLVLTAQQDGPDPDNPTTNVSIFEFHPDGTISVTDTQTDNDTPQPVVSFFARLTPAT